MSNERSILIVDSDVAFATMLQEGLEQGGDYHTTVAANGDEALQALASAEFDLVIVDLGLTDPDGATFARTLRQQQADLRLMLIPLMGEELPPELADLDVQGVLSKPFFLPELPGFIGDALARNVGEGPSLAETPVSAEPAATAEAPASDEPASIAKTVEPDTASAERLAEVRGSISERRMQRIIQAMTGLVQDISAEAVILTCRGGLIAHAGRLSAEEASELAQVVGENWRTSAHVAQILGQKQLRFEQSVEGGEHMFYSLSVSEDIILSAALRASVPLGMLRHSAKSTADAVRRLVGK